MQLFEIQYPWVGWIELALVVLLLLLCAIQPKAIQRSIRIVLAPIQRRYTETGSNLGSIILQIVFQLSVVTLTLLTATVALKGMNGFSMAQMGLTAAAAASVMVVKFVVDRYIQLTFRFAIKEDIYLAYRRTLWQVTCIVLMGYLIASTYLINEVVWIVPIGIAGLHYGILWWKLMNVFQWRMNHIAYVTMYVVHAEVLPLMVMLSATNYILVHY